MPSRRPFGVTLLIWMVLSLSAWGAIRSFATLRWWGVLYEFKATLSPLYLAVTGTGWGAAGVMLFWSMWSSKAWSLPVIVASIMLWLVEYWVERSFFQTPRANLPFALIASALLLAVTFACALNRNTRNFLSQSEEHEQSNEYSASA